MAGDRFQFDNRVVDQPPHRQRQSSECHDVQRRPAEAEPDERDEDRQGDGNKNDEGPAHVSEEQHDDDHRQDCSQASFTLKARDRLPDVE